MSHTHDVIVIGGGPSGVAAAVELRRRGVKDVVLLDREPDLGGATRHCSHSPFGMLEFGRVYFGASYGRRLQQAATNAGVDVRVAHTVVRLAEAGELLVSHPAGVQTLKGRRIVTATGAREMPRSARLVTGDRPVGILTTGALQSHVAFHGMMPFRRPLIVGSELVSLSAIVTCMSHGAKPVAVVESSARATARAPLTWLPKLLGIPFYKNTHIVDIKGQARVESVTLASLASLASMAKGDQRVELECDGVLFTGCFIPEVALHTLANLGVHPRSGAPEVDQFGRLENPVYFAAGNVLRAIETGGWAFREGRAVAGAVAHDLAHAEAVQKLVRVDFHDPIKLVVPGLIAVGCGVAAPAFQCFQLRMTRRAAGRIVLRVNGLQAWQKSGHWLPERRILVPLPADMTRVDHVAFTFEEHV